MGPLMVPYGPLLHKEGARKVRRGPKMIPPKKSGGRQKGTTAHRINSNVNSENFCMCETDRILWKTLWCFCVQVDSVSAHRINSNANVDGCYRRCSIEFKMKRVLCFCV